MKPKELTPEQWESVLDGFALGHYSLILGAGASVGSVNTMGAPLPTGPQLRDLLAAHYALPRNGTLALRRTYDLCDQIAQSKGLQRPAEYVAQFFRGCSVPDWYESLVKTPWRLIWTLNIDDVLENAYADRFMKQSLQSLRPSSWRDRWTGHRQNTNEVSLIHLHGRADSHDLVFGTLDYLGTDSAGGAAHRIFRDEWQSDVPRLIVGASLDDELDIAGPLSASASVVNEYPSISVRPNLGALERLSLELQGIIPIEMTAEDFFAALDSERGTALKRIQAVAPSEYRGMSPNNLAFLQSFSPPDVRVDRLHDFFAGDEPHWKDILNDFDAQRSLPDLNVHPADVFPESGLRVIVFHGELSGASTAELRFLRQCTDQGFPYLQHRGEASIQANVVHAMAKHGLRKLLRVPDLDDFPEALGRLRALCEQSGHPVVLVSSLRTCRLRGLATVLGDSLISVRVPERLYSREVDSVIEVLQANSRENVLIGLTHEQKRQFIQKQHRSDLIDALAAISRGRSFSERYALALDDVQDPGKRNLLSTVLIGSELGFNLSIGLLSRATGMPAVDIGEHLRDDMLSRLLVPERDGVTARHKGLAARASAKMLKRTERYDVTQRLARALAPYVSPMSISSRSREARICASLMDARRVVNGVGAVDASQWYQELEPEFAWNSRFWEQRALAELMADQPRYEMAESWAREAIERHRDPFSLNTLATVLLRRSTFGVLDEDLFFEGLAYADEARAALGERQDEHPFVTAITYLSRARAVVRDYPGLSRRLDALFDHWERGAKESDLWQVPESRGTLDKAIRGYRRAADVRDTQQS